MTLYRKRVLRRVKLPRTGDMDIIWPAIEAHSRAVTYGADRRNLSIRAIKLEIRLSVIEIEPETRFQFKPRHTSNWVGFHSDLVELATKPALLNDVCTNNECPLALCNESPLPHPSSRNTTILTPLNLQNLTRGLRHLVKM